MGCNRLIGACLFFLSTYQVARNICTAPHCNGRLIVKVQTPLVIVLVHPTHSSLNFFHFQCVAQIVKNCCIAHIDSSLNGLANRNNLAIIGLLSFFLSRDKICGSSFRLS